MAYNYPIGYQPYYPTQANAYPTQMNVGATQPTQNGIIWVQGEAGAKSYLIAPNTTVQLWDSEEQVIYLKSADASGMPSMKILDYVVRDSNLESKAVLDLDNKYITRDELNGLKQQISELKSKLEKFIKEGVEANG